MIGATVAFDTLVRQMRRHVVERQFDSTHSLTDSASSRPTARTETGPS